MNNAVHFGFLSVLFSVQWRYFCFLCVSHVLMWRYIQDESSMCQLMCVAGQALGFSCQELGNPIPVSGVKPGAKNCFKACWSQRVATGCQLVDPREWQQDATELAKHCWAKCSPSPLWGNLNFARLRSCNHKEGRVAQAEGGSEEAANGDAESIPLGTVCHGPGWQEEFGNILQLFDIALVLPLSTTNVERGFSTTKWIKRDWRSKLSTITLSQLMDISIQGPDIHEYNCLRALQRWWEEGQRQRKLTGWCWTCSFSQAVPLQLELLHSLETCTVIVLLLSAINWLWVYTCCWLGKYLLWVDAFDVCRVWISSTSQLVNSSYNSFKLMWRVHQPFQRKHLIVRLWLG